MIKIREQSPTRTTEPTEQIIGEAIIEGSRKAWGRVVSLWEKVRGNESGKINRDTAGVLAAVLAVSTVVGVAIGQNMESENRREDAIERILDRRDSFEAEIRSNPDNAGLSDTAIDQMVDVRYDAWQHDQDEELRRGLDSINNPDQ